MSAMKNKPESKSAESPTPSAGREAMLYEALNGQTVRCELCGHKCLIAGGQYGLCRVRENVAGTLMSRNFGRLVAVNADPIEKKPLFHVLPGSRSLSVAAAGCNFQCDFCQNWQLSCRSFQPKTGSLGRWSPGAGQRSSGSAKARMQPRRPPITSGRKVIGQSQRQQPEFWAATATTA